MGYPENNRILTRAQGDHLLAVLSGVDNKEDFYPENNEIFTRDQGNKLIELVKQKVVESFGIDKVADYLYEATFSTYNYEDGYRYTKKFKMESSACSAVRKGNFVGRNFDWYYGNEVEIVVRTKAAQGRHPTLGVCHSRLTSDQIENLKYDSFYKVIPFFVNDCINTDAGVYASINVAPVGDKGFTTGTNPGKQDLCQTMIPRYVCDYADTAKDAISLLNEVNVFAPLNEYGIECHVLICDSTDTYVVEFVNNNMVVLSSTDSDYDLIPNDVLAMTNFYLSGWNGDIKAVYSGNTVEEVTETGLTDHASGLERYNIISAAYSELSDETSFKNLMESLKYTLSYDPDNAPFWYSEFVDGGLTILDEIDDFSEIVEKAINEFNKHERNKKTWYTTHTSIYDISNKKLSVYVDEDYTNKFEFI